MTVGNGTTVVLVYVLASIGLIIARLLRRSLRPCEPSQGPSSHRHGCMPHTCQVGDRVRSVRGLSHAATTSASVRRSMSCIQEQRQTECVQMPGKMARSDPRPAFGLPEVLVAVSTSRLSCKRAAKTHNIDAGLGYIWRIADKMKLTFATRDYAIVSGGHNTWLCRFLPSLRQRGIESRALCFCTSSEDEFPTVCSLRGSEFSCTSICEEGIYTKQRMRWLFDRLAEDPPDIFVIYAVYPAAYYTGRWLREAGIPTVGICHGGGMMPFYQGLLDQFVFGEEAYRVSAFVCVSNWLELAVRLRNPKGVLLQSIPCGVPIPEKIAQKPNGRLKLAYVGRLVEEQKRISEVTRGLCRVVREVPGTEAVIYGDGPSRGAVENIIREQRNVQLAGFVESNQVPRLLSECHAVVLLSDHEGLGLS